MKGVFKIIIAIVIIALGAAAGFFAWKYEHQSVKQIAPVTVAGWQTYSSTQYGFSVQYDADYFKGVNTTAQTEDFVGYPSASTVLLQSANYNETANTYIPNINIVYIPMTYAQFKTLSATADWQSHYTPIAKFTPVTVGGKQAYTFQSGSAGMGTFCITNEAFIPMQTGSVDIILDKCAVDPCATAASTTCSASTPFSLTFTDQETQLFNQMLSTFAFTK